MKVLSNIESPDRAARADRAQSTQPKKAKGSATASSATGSAATTSVSAAARNMATERGVDAEKVSRLRELIDQGAFEMDFMLIAERIVSSGG